MPLFRGHTPGTLAGGLGLFGVPTHGIETPSRFLCTMATMNLALWSCLPELKHWRLGLCEGWRVLELGALPVASPGQQCTLLPPTAALAGPPLQNMCPGFNSLIGVRVSTDATPDRGLSWGSVVSLGHTGQACLIHILRVLEALWGATC